jgi:DNA-binding response OmpR family regulator
VPSTSSILLVHPDRKTQRVVQRILGLSHYAIDIVDDLEQGLALLATTAPLLVIVDANAVTHAQCPEFFAAARARGAEACMTLLGNAVDRIPAILGLGAVSNLLVHPMPVLAEELTITVQKLIRGDLFGAEKYLLWGTDLRETIVTRASRRSELVADLGATLKQRGQSARVASMAMLVADELISNAVHNAPRDEHGVFYRRDLARDQELELDARHQVRYRWGCDARYLAIEVTDPFGTLDRDTILGALGKNEVRETGEGAGMGIALAYRSCDHLVFNIAPGKRTEIIALIDVRASLLGPAAAGPGANPAAVATPVPVSSYNVFVERA